MCLRQELASLYQLQSNFIEPRVPQLHAQHTAMAKDRTEAEARERKEKKDKKRKRDESGAAGAEDGVVAKKEKKDKKRKSEVSIADVSMTETPLAVSKVKDVAEDNVEDSVTVAQMPLAALVPFALPLADEKAQKKVLKSVKRGMSRRHLSLRTVLTT